MDTFKTQRRCGNNIKIHRNCTINGDKQALEIVDHVNVVVLIKLNHYWMFKYLL